MTRPSVVDDLISAACDAMMVECVKQDATSGEVFSATLTLAHRTVLAARESGADLTTIRAGIERIWRELPAELSA